MAADLGGVYRLPMTWMDAARRGWRPTLLALAGLVAGLGVGAVLGALVITWLAAVWSLIDWPVGSWGHVVLYVAVVLIWPVLLLWGARGFGDLQRARFRAVLGVDIPAPPAAGAGAWPLRPVWAAPATWRQLGYHLLAMTGGVAGGLLVLWRHRENARALLAGRERKFGERVRKKRAR
jgi:glycerol-3-phosphate acyltransferase PlsY